MTILVNVKKTREDAIIPSYVNYGDACMDLRIMLPYDNFEGCQINKVSIAPHEIKIFDTCLIFELPPDHEMKIYPRSSTGIKEGLRLANGTGILDSKYRETCKIALQNMTDKIVFVEHQQRVAQFQIKPVPTMVMVEVNNVSETERGEGLGSSGKF